MYKVIGTDNKEYGPASEAELRAWLAQGRLNADSRIKVDGTQEWNRLGDLPQFASAAPASSVPPLQRSLSTAAPISGLAIASLVLGVLGLITFGLTGLLGIILGVVALVNISKSRGRLRGSGLAIGGICVSGAMLLLLPIMAAMLLPALSRAKGRAQSITCMNNVKQLNLALIMYANDHDEVLPPADKWCDLIQPYAGSRSVYHCPAQPPGRCSYAYNANLSNRKLSDVKSPDRTVLIFSSGEGWNASGRAGDMRRHAHARSYTLGFADGHTESQSRDDSLSSLQWESSATSE